MAVRILICIPHFFSRTVSNEESRQERSAILERVVQSARSTFSCEDNLFSLGRPEVRPANGLTEGDVTIALCSDSENHLLGIGKLPVDNIIHIRVQDVAPSLLGFVCHRVLAENIGDYDYFCYLEDDILITDPWLLSKIAWFTRRYGLRCLLMPNRYERSTLLEYAPKSYIDGPLHQRFLQPLGGTPSDPQKQDNSIVTEYLGHPIKFVVPNNPHSGCFFLDQEQMRLWSKHETFLDQDTSFVGPLESAATFSIARVFSLYKTTAPFSNFLEVQHAGDKYLRRLTSAKRLIPPL